MTGWLVRVAARRPLRVLLVVGVLALGGALLALRLPVSAATSTLVGGGSATGKATAVAHERFGDDAIYVLVREDLARLVLTSDLNRMLGLEGCLSGNVPAGVTPPGGDSGPCGGLARARSVRVVYGPGTFINSSVEELTSQLQDRTRQRAAQADRAKAAAIQVALAQGRSKAEADKLGAGAEKLVYAQFAQELLAMNAKYGLNLTGAPKLNDPDFVYQLVFDPARGARTPKARFAYLFPSSSSALISVRLQAGLSDAARARTVALVRQAVQMSDWKLDGGGAYVVTGAPVLAGDLTGVLASSILRLLLVAVFVMALVLALLFRARLRLLPLLLAGCAVAIVFGLLSVLGLPLTMASIAVLPILLGLCVDYGIQYQAGGAGGAFARHRGPGHRGRLRHAAALPGADGARLRGAAHRRCRGGARRRAVGGDGRVDGRGPAAVVGRVPRTLAAGSGRSCRRRAARAAAGGGAADAVVGRAAPA